MSMTQSPTETEASALRWTRLGITAAVFVLSLAADLWTKQWAWDALRQGDVVKVIPDILHFKFGFNTGSAFSFLSGVSWARHFFIAITLAAIAYMVWLALRMPLTQRFGFVAVGLIMGGAAGNLHDRFVRSIPLPGDDSPRYGVVDFIQFFYDFKGQDFWPIFNVADSALMVGVGLLLIFTYRHGEEPPAAESTAA